MKTNLLIIWVFFLLFPSVLFRPVFGPCIDDPDWPSAPCYPPGDIPIEKLREDWNGYYDYKGKEWMEMKKLEILQAMQNGTLEEWKKEGPFMAHTNVHFYFYINGKVPDIDGSYIYDNYGEQDWLTLPVPGFRDSVPPTGDMTFKIKYSGVVQSIKTISDERFDFWGFDIKLEQNLDPNLHILIPRNFPTPASFTGSWVYSERPDVVADGIQVNYETVEDPCYFHYKIPIVNKTNVEISYVVIATGEWQLYSPIQFEENDPCYANVFFTQSVESGFVSSNNSPTQMESVLSGNEKAGSGSPLLAWSANDAFVLIVMIAAVVGITTTVIFMKSRKNIPQ